MGGGPARFQSRRRRRIRSSLKSLRARRRRSISILSPRAVRIGAGNGRNFLIVARRRLRGWNMARAGLVTPRKGIASIHIKIAIYQIIFPRPMVAKLKRQVVPLRVLLGLRKPNERFMTAMQPLIGGIICRSQPIISAFGLSLRSAPRCGGTGSVDCDSAQWNM